MIWCLITSKKCSIGWSTDFFQIMILYFFLVYRYFLYKNEYWEGKNDWDHDKSRAGQKKLGSVRWGKTRNFFCALSWCIILARCLPSPSIPLHDTTTTQPINTTHHQYNTTTQHTTPPIQPHNKPHHATPHDISWSCNADLDKTGCFKSLVASTQCCPNLTYPMSCIIWIWIVFKLYCFTFPACMSLCCIHIVWYSCFLL